MTKDAFILAVDHGTSGAKTALMTPRGQLVGFEFEPTPVRFLPHGGAEQEPGDWWRAITVTSRRLMERGLVKPDQVKALCCSSTFSSTVAVDEKGRNLGPALTWMDSRGAPYIREAAGGFPSFDGYGVFKMLGWIRKTAGGPQLSGKDDIAHVLLWQHEFPEVYQKARAFLGSKDYLNLRLTGKIAASHDSMTLFWVTNVQDINNPHYDQALIKKLGIDGSKLPPMMRSIDVVGDLTGEAAAELGLLPGVKVVCGSPDHQSAGIGSGAVRDFEGHVYIGTSSWVQCMAPFKKTDVLHSIATLPTAIPGKYYVANEQDIAGGALSFLVNNFLYPGEPVNPAAPPDDIYRRLDQAAELSHPGAGNLIFTPWLNGERTPVDNTTVRAGFHNLSVTTTPRDVVRAVLEGVALNTRWALKYVERFCGRKLDPLNLVGGGAKSPLWCQIFADVLDREIRRVQDPIQTNARGAAFIAAVGLGLISFDDIPNLVRITDTYRPNPQNRKLYDDLFAEFQEIYRKNKGIYKRLNREE